MQNTIVQHHPKKEKKLSSPETISCIDESAVRASFNILRQSVRSLKDRRAREPTFLRNGKPPFTRRKNECFVQILQLPRVEEMTTTFSCEASFKFQELKRYENEAFVRGFLQIPKVEDMKTTAFVRGFLQIPRVEEMKTKLSCEASFKFQELKR